MMAPVSFAHICARLGIDARPRPWQRGHIRHLIADHGFPAPLPMRPLARAASWRWDPRAVDCWFDDRAGGRATQAGEQAAIENAALLLDQRAALLAATAPRHASPAERIAP